MIRPPTRRFESTRASRERLQDETASADASASTQRLDRSLLHGVAWTGAARWSTQVLSWAATFILARLLTPDDFGLVGLAAVYVGFVALVTEMGLGTAIVTFRDLTEHEIAQINGLALLVGLGGFLVTCAIAVPVGLFFKSPHLPPVIVVTGVSFIVSSLKTVPIGVLQKELRFKLIAGIEAGQAVLLAVAQTAFALMGLRYWSLVLGELTALGIITAVIVAYRHRGFAAPNLKALRRVTTFTSHLLVTRISWYTYSNADFVIVGRILGVAPLGIYKMAWGFSSAPMQKIVEIVTRVTPAVFSAVQSDLAALRRYVLMITEAMALLTLPASVGLALVADDFVRFALGSTWLGVIVPLRLLGGYVAMRTISTIPSQVLTIIGETRFTMKNGLFALVFMPSAFLVGSHWGSAGVATAWIVAYPVIVAPVYIRLFRRIEMRLSSYLSAVGPSVSGTLAMAAAVLTLRLALPADLAPVARLASQIGCGGGAYALWLFLFHRRRIIRVVGGVRRIGK